MPEKSGAEMVINFIPSRDNSRGKEEDTKEVGKTFYFVENNIRGVVQQIFSKKDGRVGKVKNSRDSVPRNGSSQASGKRAAVHPTR